jgi:flagellar assembly protein FliH
MGINTQQPDPGVAATAPARDAEQAYREGLNDGRSAGAHDVLAETREAARLQGFEQGVRQGQDEGRTAAERNVLLAASAAQEMTAARLEKLDHLLAGLPAQFRSALVTRLQSAEDDMVALCHAVICRILGETTVTAQHVVGSVRRAVEQWTSSGGEGVAPASLTILVHPEDLRTLRADPAIHTWLAQQHLAEVRWQEDPQIELGGCVVRTAQGSLDARLETQLATLHKLLKQGRSSTAPQKLEHRPSASESRAASAAELKESR